MDTLSTDPSMLQAWADIHENMPDAVFIVASKGNAGRILHLNSQDTRMFGYVRCEIVNQSIEILVPESVREHTFNIIAVTRRVRTYAIWVPDFRYLAAAKMVLSSQLMFG